jgi:predicted nucleic acid-binding protein
MNVLIDTSVWSLALRRKHETLGRNEQLLVMELSELIREGRAKVIGLVRQELLSGIKSNEQYEKLRLYLRAFPDELLDTFDYEEAAKAGNRCRAKGIVVSIVDVLLCAVTVRRGWSIFTTDPDFSHYGRVLPQEFRFDEEPRYPVRWLLRWKCPKRTRPSARRQFSCRE